MPPTERKYIDALAHEWHIGRAASSRVGQPMLGVARAWRCTFTLCGAIAAPCHGLDACTAPGVRRPAH